MTGPYVSRWPQPPLGVFSTYLRRGVTPTYADNGVLVLSQAVNQTAGLDWSKARRHAISGAEREKASWLHPDDIVINSTGSGTLGRVGRVLSPVSAVADSHVTVARIDKSVAHSGFVYWALSGTEAHRWMNEVLAVGATNQVELNPERLASMPLPLPALNDQRRIAEFLDDQTAAIDRSSELASRAIALVSELETSAFESVVKAFHVELPTVLGGAVWDIPNGWRVLKLSQVLDQLTNGYVGPTRDILFDQGVRYIQGMHIKNGRINFERRPFFVSQEWHDARPRIHLREGDVLIVQTGDIGQVAVVPEGFGPASCHALQILRVRSSVISGPYLAAFLRSTFGQGELMSMATGALHPHLEGSIRSISVLLPPLELQAKIVRDTSEMHHANEALVSAFRTSRALLAERRQALVTAAVTGEFDVATAARRIA